MEIKLQMLRTDVRTGKRPLRITSHAQIEAAKDGILLADLKHVFENGLLIESYPEDNRMLLYEKTVMTDVPVHIIIEDTAVAGIIVTAYVPDKSKWLANVKRRRTK